MRLPSGQNSQPRVKCYVCRESNRSDASLKIEKEKNRVDLNCGEVKARAERYVAKVLSQDERVAVQGHIGECAPCCLFIVGTRRALRGEISGAVEVTQQAGLSR